MLGSKFVCLSVCVSVHTYIDISLTLLTQDYNLLLPKKLDYRYLDFNIQLDPGKEIGSLQGYFCCIDLSLKGRSIQYFDMKSLIMSEFLSILHAFLFFKFI